MQNLVMKIDERGNIDVFDTAISEYESVLSVHLKPDGSWLVDTGDVYECRWSRSEALAYGIKQLVVAPEHGEA